MVQLLADQHAAVRATLEAQQRQDGEPAGLRATAEVDRCVLAAWPLGCSQACRATRLGPQLHTERTVDAGHGQWQQGMVMVVAMTSRSVLRRIKC